MDSSGPATGEIGGPPATQPPRRGLGPFANGDINWLAVHTTLHTLAWFVSGGFWTVFLLRAGIRPSIIFLAMAAILVLRFAARPLVLLAVRTIGPRRSLILGVLFYTAQYPALAFVTGPDLSLVVYSIITALGAVFYWTCYHAFFAAVGDRGSRGSQLAVRQFLVSLACVIGPAAGGMLLTTVGPWAAFGASALIELSAA